MWKVSRFFWRRQRKKQVYDCKRYINLFEEEKKWGYGHKQYKNLPEDETKKLIEYRKIISKCIKTLVLKMLVSTYIKKR